MPAQGGRLASIIQDLQVAGTWDVPALDLVPYLVVRLPDWPDDRALVIEDASGMAYAAFAANAGQIEVRSAAAQRDPIRIQRTLVGGKRGLSHYNTVVRGRPVAVEADGDCLFRAILAARDHRAPPDISPADIDRLRGALADYVDRHPEDVTTLMQDIGMDGPPAGAGSTGGAISGAGPASAPPSGAPERPVRPVAAIAPGILPSPGSHSAGSTRRAAEDASAQQGKRARRAPSPAVELVKREAGTHQPFELHPVIDNNLPILRDPQDVTRSLLAEAEKPIAQIAVTNWGG
jgi:hypothetical protein